jgi:CheY-like chemotaxis protein
MLEKEKNYKVVAAVSDGAIVVREWLRLRSDVIILDISMGEISGIDIARQLRDVGCSAKIVFLTSVKILTTGQKEFRKFPSGPEMTPQQMVSGVKELVSDWKYDVVSIGYPGLVLKGRPAAEPHNLGQASSIGLFINVASA